MRRVTLVMRTTALLSLALASTLWLPTTTVADEGPPDDALERAATRLAFSLELELERHNRSPRDRFVALRGAVESYQRFAADRRVRQCVGGRAASRAGFCSVVRRLRRTALDVRAAADNLCSRHVDALLDPQLRTIERATESRHLGIAALHVDQLARALDGDVMVRDCAARAARVAKVRDAVLPAVRDMVALPKVTAELAARAGRLQQTWSAATAALATRGATLTPVPSALVDPDERAAFARDARGCMTLSSSARALGAGLDDALPTAPGTAASISLRQAEQLCAEITTGLAAVSERAIAHNARFAELTARRWRRRHIKGWNMKQVYDAHGQPQQVRVRAGGQIVWTYRRADGRCTSHRFGARGKRLGSSVRGCDRARTVSRR